MGEIEKRELDYQIMRSFLKYIDNPLGNVSAHVKACIDTELTPRQREITELYYRNQMYMKDIGAALGITTQAVYGHLMRSRRKIRRYLKYIHLFIAEE
ncbi:hypothetical protein LJC01_02620 [Clostridiaceae bacterium OttesenSCG-928-D20]|nr:hypothetical protein [Clostridiaceae bacterium OttesenSCG-928-D20]